MRLRVKPATRRTPSQRLKSKLYYRKNRARIRMQRRRYLRKYRTTIKHRKMFMRFKPKWFRHPAPKKTRPKKLKLKPPRRVTHRPHSILHAV